MIRLRERSLDIHGTWFYEDNINFTSGFMIQFKISEDNMLCHKDKISNDSGKLSG